MECWSSWGGHVVGVNSGTWDMSRWPWTYKISMRGEDMSLHTVGGSSCVKWSFGSHCPAYIAQGKTNAEQIVARDLRDGYHVPCSWLKQPSENSLVERGGDPTKIALVARS
ncbi:hypothetical protein ACLB2K_046760 [Fragaria x ananassa]